MRNVLISASAVVLGVLGVIGAPSPAQAADLTCDGTPSTDSVFVDGLQACGARADSTSRAFARALDSVAFARADRGGGAIGLAQDGGVAAAETESGQVAATAFGPDAVSIVSADPGAFALALSLAKGQTFVGTAHEGVRCEAGPGFAVNLSLGQVCLSDGVNTWSSIPAVP
ncbi:hypothetical protein QMK17_14900 [Rhodococcus sp. G-MC3]|uniref:DUF6764 family protein n=1 Tax=Rhodococcus sp. G-MC3 TaxID=3046209 RepID=UPI0024BB713D|nr:DUF6764 family protein [Rhodococcus sp. G-MC3]MDJ0394610.1 hypothetical protein [Rhodococcus sp. G-MC3]